MLTNQHYFTETILYLRRQERQAADLHGCRYRTKDHNKCAVGYWIPDNKYQRIMEDGGVFSLSKHYPSLAGVAWPDTLQGLDLANDLQELHDKPVYRNTNGSLVGGLNYYGEQRAEEIARKYNLTYTPTEGAQ